MITNTERIMAHTDFASVRSAYIFRARIESGRIADARKWMLDNGLELLDVPDDALLADDGREILRAHGKAWALRTEIHAQRLRSALERSKQRDAAIEAQEVQRPEQTAPPTTCTSMIDGQLCGGNLTLAQVCPRCPLGKQGAVATMTCDVCGHVSAIMRGDA